MKLRNKKTGETGHLIVGKDCDCYTVANDNWESCGKYDSLAELNENWEDYEEPKPKDIWWLDNEGFVNHASIIDEDCFERNKEFGNYFETEEEAELAVQKLKAWKRLKDKKFDKVFNLGFSDALCGGKTVEFRLLIDDEASIEDIKLLFGGKE